MAVEKHSEKKTGAKQILVTGGSGLVGNELITQLLNAGERVTALQHTSSINISHPSLSIVQCDILDVSLLEKIMQDITPVYHAAALVSYSPKDKKQLLKINVEGTANVVNACINNQVQKLVHVSSVAALGRIRNGEMVTEKMNWTEETSNSIYGKSKYYGEMEVWRGAAEGLQVVIVNPSLIFGGTNWESGSSAIFKKAYEEFPWYTNGVTGIVDVRDVARAMMALMKSDITSERFILNGENLSYKEIFTTIANGFDKKPPSKKVTPFLAEIVWRMEAIKSRITNKKSLLTKETARTAQAKVYFDNQKILKALPQFHFTNIKDTIEFTCNRLIEKYQLK